MQTCIQNGVLIMDKNLDNVVVSVRLRGAEAARFWRVMDKAKTRNPYIDKTNVIRELLGLDPPAILSLADIEHFQGKAIIGKTKSGVLHLPKSVDKEKTG